jgi:chemotaxis-related protein WspB
MLFVVFQLDSDAYAVDAGQVAEVLPLVRLKELPQAGAGVAGVFTCRGEPVPVLDLCALALGRPARPRMSTRLLLVHYPMEDGGTRRLGVMVERATQTLRMEADEFREAGVKNDGAPFLGPVAEHDGGLVQWVRIERLLPAEMRERLFTEAEREMVG